MTAVLVGRVGGSSRNSKLSKLQYYTRRVNVNSLGSGRGNTGGVAVTLEGYRAVRAAGRHRRLRRGEHDAMQPPHHRP